MINLRLPEDVRELKSRFQAMVFVVLLAFVGLTARLCQLQVLEGEHYARRAERNYIDIVDVEAPRGRIFDNKGNTLATNRPAYTLYLTAWTRAVVDVGGGVDASSSQRQPMDSRSVDLLLSLLEFVDDEDRQKFEARIDDLRKHEQEGRYAIPVRQNLTWEEYARVESRLDQLGAWVEIRESSRRFYPDGELAAFITGHMGNIDRDMLKRAIHAGYRPGDRVGQTGIERQWENYLRGRLGSRSRVVDARRREVVAAPAEAVASLPPPRSPIPGQDIYLTLDRELQKVAWEAFAGKLAGALVAMEPDSGRILAMVSMPAIDPNRYEQPIPAVEWKAWANSPLKPFIDKTVQEHFFPGSTYKVVSALAALEDPEFDPNETIDCDGYLAYGGRRFRDVHKHGEDIDLEQAIIRSCNVYFYQLAMQRNLSLERMARFARILGLGERTGLGLNNEVKGRIPTEAFEAREGTYQRGVRLNSAIGQGNVKVTVLQMGVVYSIIANGGYAVTPFIVDRVMTNDGKLVFSSTPSNREQRIIDAGDRERIHRGLVGVVNDELGTAFSERMNNVLVAGKTGTAQVGREVDHDAADLEGWDTSQDHAWFAGYAPAEQPRIVVVALVEHGGAGADAAAPIVTRVIRHFLGATRTDSVAVRPAGDPPPLPGHKRVVDGQARAEPNTAERSR